MDTIERWINIAVAAWPLVLIIFTLVYPFIPGPVRAWIQARRDEARSNVHFNDTTILLDTMWRGYQDARRRGMSQQASMTFALSYAATNRPDLIAKMGATTPVMTSMLGSKIQDHEDALLKTTAAVEALRK